MYKILVSQELSHEVLDPDYSSKLGLSGNVVILADDSGKEVFKDSVPVISTLGELRLEKDLLLFIGIKESIIYDAGFDNALPVILRKEANKASADHTIVLDNYGQLEFLLQLPAYEGLKTLMVRRNWSASDFKTAVLENYKDALDTLNTVKSSAVFGAQRLGERVMEGLLSMGMSVQAFIDNSVSKHGEYISQLPILPLTEVSDKSLPIIIATTRFTSSIMNQLEDAGYQHVIPYAVMSLLDPSKFPDEIPYIDIQSDLAEHFSCYLSLFLTLSDDRSREVLNGLLQYRMNYDPRYAQKVADDYDRQYFDKDLLKFSGSDVFVDLGGFDGDTVEKFIQYSAQQYKKIYMFEPDEELLKKAKHRLEGHRDIEFIPAGAYSKDGELRFSASGRTNGAICDEGELVIAVNKVDTVVDGDPSILKMDIEGSEEEALRGAGKKIKISRPKLTIAAYHYGRDLWHLAEVIRELNSDYRFYLRHYSETGLESVIYAI